MDQTPQTVPPAPVAPQPQSAAPTGDEPRPDGREEERKRKALRSIGKIYGKSAEEEQKKEKYMKGLFGGEVPGMAERRKKLTQERGPQMDQ